ncbi:MAG: hypothetical protein OXH76_09995, partial [Boseongicola sp.]|nr:hypothetical protein [Boseongicola sp.]
MTVAKYGERQCDLPRLSHRAGHTIYFLSVHNSFTGARTLFSFVRAVTPELVVIFWIVIVDAVVVKFLMGVRNAMIDSGCYVFATALYTHQMVCSNVEPDQIIGICV